LVSIEGTGFFTSSNFDLLSSLGVSAEVLPVVTANYINLFKLRGDGYETISFPSIFAISFFHGLRFFFFGIFLNYHAVSKFKDLADELSDNSNPVSS
jgi:hypothetical protein